MTHDTLVNGVWGAHLALLAGVVTVWCKYGDRSETFSKSLQGVDSLLTKLRRRLASELGAHLTPTIKSMKVTVSPIVAPNGENYTEKPADVTDSEIYKECLQKFIEHEGEALADFRLATLAKATWCAWSKRLSWLLLLAMFWSGGVMLTVLILEKVFECQIYDVLLKWAWVITGVILAACMVTLPFQLWTHDKLCDLRMRHDVP